MSDRIFWIERLPGYHYHDTPEGQDCLKKVVFMNKVGLIFGLGFGTYDVLSYSKPVGMAAIAARYAVVTYPILAAATTWTTVSCLSASIRNKDDTYNYFWGGFASGCVLGAIYRNGVLGTVTSVTFGLFGYLKRELEDLQGGALLNPKQKYTSIGGIHSIHYDFSLCKEYPRGWKTAED